MLHKQKKLLNQEINANKLNQSLSENIFETISKISLIPISRNFRRVKSHSNAHVQLECTCEVKPVGFTLPIITHFQSVPLSFITLWKRNTDFRVIHNYTNWHKNLTGFSECNSIEYCCCICLCNICLCNSCNCSSCFSGVCTTVANMF